MFMHDGRTYVLGVGIEYVSRSQGQEKNPPGSSDANKTFFKWDEWPGQRQRQQPQCNALRRDRALADLSSFSFWRKLRVVVGPCATLFCSCAFI